MIDRNKIVVLSLRWTPLNIAHIARKDHEATPEEVEQVVFNSQSIARRAHSGRTMIIGETKTGRLLAVVIDPEGNGVWFVLTAHSPSAGDRKLYRDEMKRRGQHEHQ